MKLAHVVPIQQQQNKCLIVVGLSSSSHTISARAHDQLCCTIWSILTWISLLNFKHSVRTSVMAYREH